MLFEGFQGLTIQCVQRADTATAAAAGQEHELRKWLRVRSLFGQLASVWMSFAFCTARKNIGHGARETLAAWVSA